MAGSVRDILNLYNPSDPLERAWTIPAGTWDHFDPTTYYVRMLSLPDLRPLGAWKFQKTSGARAIASDADFLARLADSHLPAEMAP